MAGLKPWHARAFAEARAKARQPKPDTAPVLKQPEVDGKHFSFLDLSAELRNAIYEYSLAVPGGILIRRRSRWNNWIAESSWSSDHDSTMSPNLLATCKLVHKEGTPMLYGLNHFTLQSSSSSDEVTNTWTKSIGTSLKHLRFLILSGARTQVILKSILNDLTRPTRLESLVIGAGCFENFRMVNTMANGLWPLVHHLQSSHKYDNKKKPALEVLQIRGYLSSAVVEALKEDLGL